MGIIWWSWRGKAEKKGEWIEVETGLTSGGRGE